jgi:hypothetical protein
MTSLPPPPTLATQKMSTHALTTPSIKTPPSTVVSTANSTPTSSPGSLFVSRTLHRLGPTKANTGLGHLASLLHRPHKHWKCTHRRPDKRLGHRNRHKIQHCFARFLHPGHPRRRTVQSARQETPGRNLFTVSNDSLGHSVFMYGLCKVFRGVGGLSRVAGTR